MILVNTFPPIIWNLKCTIQCSSVLTETETETETETFTMKTALFGLFYIFQGRQRQLQQQACQLAELIVLVLRPDRSLMPYFFGVLYKRKSFQRATEMYFIYEDVNTMSISFFSINVNSTMGS